MNTQCALLMTNTQCALLMMNTQCALLTIKTQRAFSAHSDFTLSYLARDTEGQEVYLSMLSDWDMDAAFQCAADPYLKLKVDLKPFDQGQLGGKSNVPFYCRRSCLP